MAESGYLRQIINDSFSTTIKGIFNITPEYAALEDNEAFLLGVNTTSLAASSWLDMQLNITSSTYDTYLMCVKASLSPGIYQYELIEASTGTTMSAGSSTITPIQSNRNCTTAPVFTAFSDPTNVSSTGNLQVENFFVGSTGSVAFGGVTYFMVEDCFLKLKYNSTYVIRMTNLSGNAGYASLSAKIHEHLI
jgi:hypothetical protein